MWKKPRTFNISFKLNSTPSCFGHGIHQRQDGFAPAGCFQQWFQGCALLWTSMVLRNSSWWDSGQSPCFADPLTHPFCHLQQQSCAWGDLEFPSLEAIAGIGWDRNRPLWGGSNQSLLISSLETQAKVSRASFPSEKYRFADIRVFSEPMLCFAEALV